MPLADYTTEFEELLSCLEKYEIKLPPVVLAYQYLIVQTLQKSKVPLLGPEIFGSDLDIICSTSMHYCITIFSYEHIDHENKNEVLLSMNDINSKEEKRKVVTQAVWTPHVSKLI